MASSQFIELAEPSLSFSREVTLRDGTNALEVVAVDLLGHLTRQQHTVTLDRQGPLVSVSQLDVLGGPSQPRLRVHGALTDASGVARLTLAAQPIPLQPGQEQEFRAEVPLRPGTAEVPIEAVDAAGNVTRGTLTLASESPGIRHGVVPGVWRWASLPAPATPSRSALEC